MKHAGEHVAQEAEEGREILAKQRVPGKEPASQQHGDDRFQHVAENDHEGQSAAEGPVKIRQSGVSAAVVPYIVPEDILGHNHRAVEAAQEIGSRRRNDHRQNQPQSRRPCVDETLHTQTSLSPLCRTEILMGVPSRPKVLRMQFSRYRW